MRRDNQRSDNFNATHSDIARRILDSGLIQFVGYPNDAHRLTDLTLAAQGSANVSPMNFLSVTFRKAGTDCSLDVLTRAVNNHPDIDQEGNEWKEYSLSCTISFPCLGSSDPATVMARLKLYQDVALLAAEIQAEHQKVTRLACTAATIAAAKAKQLEQEINAAARKTVVANCNAMRLGSEKRDIEISTMIPEGDYVVDVNDSRNFRKTYVLKVAKVGVANMRRAG